MQTRCAWSTNDSLYTAYHDQEWGVPLYEDPALFEFLLLEGAQAGLSWITILKKRDNYRTAFDQFNPVLIAAYDLQKVEELLQNPGIIRNRLKVQSAILNAQAFLKIKEEFGSFSTYIWSFVGGKTLINHWASQQEVPTHTSISDTMSRDLKKRGFKFVGSTICYSFMQATGMVMDHLTTCYRHEELSKQTI